MAIGLLLCPVEVWAQVAPAPVGKYNTTNYPEDRKAIEASAMVQDSTVHLNDDLIAVGPEGKFLTATGNGRRALTTPRLPSNP